MAKGFGMNNMPGMGNMMKQVQKMAADTERIEAELAELRIEASSGGGMVTAAVNGKSELLDITINREVVDPDDVEMLQDLVVSAVREALETAQQTKADRLSDLTGGMNIPGLF